VREITQVLEWLEDRAGGRRVGESSPPAGMKSIPSYPWSGLATALFNV
jgi:hypothetical protein